MINPNWVRWLYASIYFHFSNWNDSHLHIISDGTFPISYINSANILESQAYAELRVQGPRIRNVQKGVYQFNLTVNCLVVSKFNDNCYDLHTRMGYISQAFESIIAYKFGVEGEDNDFSPIGCMYPADDLRIESYGWDKQMNYNSGSLESEYRMELKS